MRACWAARKLHLPCPQPVAFGTLSGFHRKALGMGLELDSAPWLPALGVPTVWEQTGWGSAQSPPQPHAASQDPLSPPGSLLPAHSIPITFLIYP